LLERIALHQTRLHTPGLGLDPKGVALGAKGLILLPSLDRLVALLALYTRAGRSLEDLMASLAMHVVTSRLGTREIAVEFAAESSDRMDRLAETSRLVGGFTFTGTSRHFVQYRDAAAPFGYDAVQLLATDSALALYHDRFLQVYDLERRIELRPLLLRLMLQLDPATKLDTGPRVLVAEQGLGPALVHYLVRSRVDGDVCVAEWPPDSAFEEELVRRWIVRVPDLPTRMRSLIHETPGMTGFVPVAPGVAVEAGFRHPIELRACPVFDSAGLVLLRGHGQEPWTIDRLPPMGALAALSRVELRIENAEAAGPNSGGAAPLVRVPLRLAPATGPWRDVTATWIEPGQIPLLRRLAYALPRSILSEARVAMTSHGAFLRCAGGIEAIPLGTFYVEAAPRIFVPAGQRVTPAVAPDVLARALGAPGSVVLFLAREGSAVGVDEDSFVPLEAALLASPPWEPAIAEAIEAELAEPSIDLKVAGVGLLPLRGVDSGPSASESGPDGK
jgi:hypothetical protein